MPAALPLALNGPAISGLKGGTKFSCLDGFARQSTLFDKVSEDIQDRGIAWSHQNRAFLSGVSNPAKCACKIDVWHLPDISVSAAFAFAYGLIKCL